MFTKKGFLKLITGIFFALFFGMLFSESAYADSVSDILRGESVGASKVLSSTAYNEASVDKIGLTVESEDELDATILAMANVLSVLNVRSGPSLNDKVVGKLYKDCGGIVLERGEEWSLIESGDVVGWCKSDYLLFDEEAVEFAKEVGITNAIVNLSCITVRTEADDNSDALGFVTQNTLMEVIEETDDGWVNVAYEDKEGYVKADYVRLEFRIDHAESIEAIAARRKAEQEKKNQLKRQNEAIAADADTLKLLASLIYCEARGESYEGMQAVGAVVMNRVRSQAYPNTVYDVIFASGQFSPAMSGSLQKVYAQGPSSICYQAAQEALDGYSNVGEMTHFRRKGSKEGFVIGNHVFY